MTLGPVGEGAHAAAGAVVTAEMAANFIIMAGWRFGVFLRELLTVRCRVPPGLAAGEVALAGVLALWPVRA